MTRLTAVAALLALSACGAAGGVPAASAPPPPAACASLPAAVGPDVSGSLAETDNGGRFCLGVGQTVSVFLRVPLDQADTGRFSSIVASDSSVLQAVPSGALTLVRGVTAGIFTALRAGTSTLSSTRPPCAASVASGCPAGQGWQVTIVVQG
ncbi:MAG: hypothetical protein ACYDAC_12595 [Candidatus Dormibacteria bacterium]